MADDDDFLDIEQARRRRREEARRRRHEDIKKRREEGRSTVRTRGTASATSSTASTSSSVGKENGKISAGSRGSSSLENCTPSSRRVECSRSSSSSSSLLSRTTSRKRSIASPQKIECSQSPSPPLSSSRPSSRKTSVSLDSRNGNDPDGSSGAITSAIGCNSPPASEKSSSVNEEGFYSRSRAKSVVDDGSVTACGNREDLSTVPRESGIREVVVDQSGGYGAAAAKIESPSESYERAVALAQSRSSSVPSTSGVSSVLKRRGITWRSYKSSSSDDEEDFEALRMRSAARKRRRGEEEQQRTEHDSTRTGSRESAPQSPSLPTKKGGKTAPPLDPVCSPRKCASPARDDLVPPPESTEDYGTEHGVASRPSIVPSPPFSSTAVQNSHSKTSTGTETETAPTQSLSAPSKLETPPDERNEESSAARNDDDKIVSSSANDDDPDDSSAKGKLEYVDDYATPIVAKLTPTPSGAAEWIVRENCLLVRTVLSSPSSEDAAPRIKVAGFDLDGTLLTWRCSGWPSRPDHYELWSSSVPSKLRELHDKGGYKLVVFSNQGGIRGAFGGKTAAKVKGIIEWIALLVDRPLYAVCSTKKDGGYHKGAPGMWRIMERACNHGTEISPEHSFFVGDSDGADEEDPQGGVDSKFAENVGKNRGGPAMAFYTPKDYFGPSNADRRRSVAAAAIPPPPPPEALVARTALLGGYYTSGPILLLLCGAQGSGKSTFGASLARSSERWSHVSQDTIGKGGRPGKREAVERVAEVALREGRNVVVDRMHLDAEQRKHFVGIGKVCGAPVHALVMMASADDVRERVRNRTNHPGQVEGENGARMAVTSLAKVVYPKYDEGFDLISYTHEVDGFIRDAYLRVAGAEDAADHTKQKLHLVLGNESRATLPMISFGTMGIGKRAAESVLSEAVREGFTAIDTAPTYKNEAEVGRALDEMSSTTYPEVFVVIKIPKRVTEPAHAREEVMQSLRNLKQKSADLLLLHWPCDFIEAGTLKAVWAELENMQKEGLFRLLGVSNFSVGSLQSLLACCTVRPAVNQIERHPLLPQHELLEYCASQGVAVQAHSPLGHGSSLLLENESIVRISNESDLSPAQVLLRWNIQQGVAVVTKCSSREHMVEAIAVLKTPVLTPEHMKEIDSISHSFDTPHRFVSPPFMFRPAAIYSWGDKPYS